MRTKLLSSPITLATMTICLLFILLVYCNYLSIQIDHLTDRLHLVEQQAQSAEIGNNADLDNLQDQIKDLKKKLQAQCQKDNDDTSWL
jgi:cell division protein FtsL